MISSFVSQFLATASSRIYGRYPQQFHDCNGVCIGGFDCAGVCGGDAVHDLCGICGGDSTSCGHSDMAPFNVEHERRLACNEARGIEVNATEIGENGAATVLANEFDMPPPPPDDRACACSSPFQRFKLKLFPNMDQRECAARCLAEPRCVVQVWRRFAVLSCFVLVPRLPTSL